MSGGQGDRPGITPVRWSVDAIRPEDLFIARIEFVHMVRQVRKTPMGFMRATVEPDASDKSSIVLHLQGQNIGEQAFFETDEKFPVERPAGEPDDPDDDSASETASIPVATRLAGPSRLVFRVPKGAPPIGFSIAEILDACRGLALRLAPTALPPRSAGVKAFQPAWVTTLQGQLDGGATRFSPAGRVRAMARLQRWQDESALLPVTRVGSQNLVGRWNPAPNQPVLVIGQRVVIEQAVVADMQIRPFQPRLREPLPEETALELPFRLWLSPNLHARFTHASEPVRSPASGRSELWHTRLATLVAAGRGSIVDEHAHPHRTVRAIWSRDQIFDSPNLGRPAHSTTDPFRTSLDVSDRWDIVHESADFNIPISTIGPAKDYEPVPIDVNRLMLTSLGAWLDSRGQWTPPTKSFEVEEWRHRATMARDHYVRVVYKGYLFPFGHRASLVKVTERRFHNLPGRPAFLRQRMFILVRQPLLTFGEPLLKNSSGHFYDLQMPLVSARITTQATPDLDDPANSDFATTASTGGTLQSLFWPKVAKEYFRFQIVAEDSDANRLEFSAPLAFVSNIHSVDTALLGKLRADYENATDATSAARRTVDLRGQRMAFAQSTERGDTTFEVDQLVLGAEIPAAPLAGDRASFYPRVKRATIVIPTIKLLTGGSGETAVTYPDTYLKGGFPLNPGEVYLETDSTPLDFSKGGDRSGGLAQPSMSVTGLSRIMGPIGGPPHVLAGGTFTPAQFFGGMNAKLFGVIDLADLIEAVGLADLDLVPKFVTEALGAADSFLKQIEGALAQLGKLKSAAQQPGSNLDAPVDLLVTALGQVVTAVETMVAGNLAQGPLSAALDEVRLKLGDLRKGVDGLPPAVSGEVKKASLATIDRLTRDIAEVNFVTRMAEALQVPDELKVSFEWKPEIRCWPKPDDEAGSIFINHGKKKAATFSISAVAEAKTKLRPSPSFDVACRLHNFSLNLFPSASFLRLHFNKIEFTAGSATKPDVTCDFDDVEFVGVLSFVEVLRDFIPLDGFSDPPALDVSEKGIVASYSMGLPNIAFGVFSLEQLSLGAGFTIPFLLDPLSVRFNFCERQRPFLLTVSAIGGGGFFGITLDPDGIQMLEASFECGASLSINLGVASGSVHIMVGIYFKMQGDEAVLEGYFRIGGEMDILGLISASIELYLSLTYEFSSGKCVGRATLTVEIEIFLVSMSVEVSCERKFAGSNGDPSFKELMVAEGDREPWTDYCEAFA